MKRLSNLLFVFIFISVLISSCHRKQTKNVSETGAETESLIVEQIDTAKFRRALTELIASKDSAEQSVYNQFYLPNNYSSYWFDDISQLSSKINILKDFFSKSTEHGIPTERFSVKPIDDLLAKINEKKLDYKLLAKLELLVSKRFFNYCTDINYGCFNPLKLYPDEYFIPVLQPDSAFIVRIFSKTDSLDFLLNELQPKSLEYRTLQSELQVFSSLADSTFEKIPLMPPKRVIKLGEKHSSVPLIARRLMITGELPFDAGYDTVYTVFNDTVLTALNAFRKRYNLLIDKEIGNQTINMLNTDFASMYWTVAANLERLRWKPRKQMSRRFVEVNVANMTLRAMRGDTLVQMMKVVVGKPPKQKTPLLLGNMYELVLNPTWTVPNSIILNEISKKMVSDPSYLNRNRMKVYQKRVEVSQYSVPWERLTEKYQPYVIVQDSGANNSLGRIKFNFGNPFNVYLHDTNAKSAFYMHNRALSHGCVRVEKPLDLAFFCLHDVDSTNEEQMNRRYLLQDKIRYTIGLRPVTPVGKDSIIGKNVLKLSQVKLKPGVSILLDYRTCFSGKNGDVQFCNDHYKMDSLLIVKLKTEK